MPDLQRESLVKTYFKLTPDSRANFLTEYLEGDPANVHLVWDLLDIYSADPTLFSEGIKRALQREPDNLAANRALVWIVTRENRFGDAIRALQHLVQILPAAVVEQRELLRLGCVAPDHFTDEVYEMGLQGITTPLCRASYLYQTGRVRGGKTLQRDAEALRQAFRDAAGEVRRQIVEQAADQRTPLTDFIELLDGAKRIALVGNGPSLRGAGRGQEIDRYDLVIRCNFPVIANFTNDVGSRTDVVLFTEALFRLFEMYLDRDPSYKKARLMTIANPAAAASADPEQMAKDAGMSLARFPADVLDFMHEATYRHLTTGATAYLLLAAMLGRQITIFGFDFYSSKELHYFSQSAGLWLPHEVQYEKFLFQGMVKPVFGAFNR